MSAPEGRYRRRGGTRFIKSMKRSSISETTKIKWNKTMNKPHKTARMSRNFTERTNRTLTIHHTVIKKLSTWRKNSGTRMTERNFARRYISERKEMKFKIKVICKGPSPGKRGTVFAPSLIPPCTNTLIISCFFLFVKVKLKWRRLRTELTSIFDNLFWSVVPGTETRWLRGGSTNESYSNAILSLSPG